MNCLLLKFETDSERFVVGFSGTFTTMSLHFQKNIVGCTPATYESGIENIAYSEHRNFRLIQVEDSNPTVKVNGSKYIALILNMQ